MAEVNRSVGHPLRRSGEIVATVGFLVVATLYGALSLIIAVIAWLVAEWSLKQDAPAATPAWPATSPSDARQIQGLLEREWQVVYPRQRDPRAQVSATSG
jgi:hypothetical protein